MEKDVTVTVKGFQSAGDTQGEVSLERIPGRYYRRGGKHYILYEEKAEEGKVTRNLVKIGDGVLDIVKHGAVDVHMQFEAGRSCTACYRTACGSLVLCIETQKVEIAINEGKIFVEVGYVLKAGGAYLADCRVEMEMKA